MMEALQIGEYDSIDEQQIDIYSIPFCRSCILAQDDVQTAKIHHHQVRQVHKCCLFTKIVGHVKVRHSSHPSSRRLSVLRKFIMPNRTRVFTVPRGLSILSAISR